MGKWYDWYENQKQWSKLLDEVQERSDEHAAAEKAKYDYPWKKLPSGQRLGYKGSGSGGSKGNLNLSSLSNLLEDFLGGGGAEAVGEPGVAGSADLTSMSGTPTGSSPFAGSGTGAEGEGFFGGGGALAAFPLIMWDVEQGSEGFLKPTLDNLVGGFAEGLKDFLDDIFS